MRRLFLKTWGPVSCCKAGFDIKHLSFPAALFQPQRLQREKGGLGHQEGGPQGQGPLSLPCASTMAGWTQDQKEQGSCGGSWWAWDANPWLVKGG